MDIHDMPKLESPFIRKEVDGEYLVTPEINPEYAWVLEGGEDEVICMEKLDGCLHYQVPIITDKGTISIGQIVNKRLPVNVLSYNFKKGVAEFMPIVAYHKEKRVRAFLNVKIKNKYHGTIPKHITCTDNHKFWTSLGWKEAKELKAGDNVFHYAKRLDFIRQQFILGGLLGDSSVYWGGGRKNCGFQFIHSIAQSEYFDLKIKVLGNICSEGKGFKGGFPGSKPNRRANSVINVNVSELVSLCLVNGNKTINNQWLDKINPVGLAVWYMDDGTLLSGNGKQRERAAFATNTYTQDETKLLQEMLKRFGINTSVQCSKQSHGNVLTISSESSDMFFSMIAPFIIKSLQYKLPEKYRTGRSYFDDYQPEEEDDLIETEIVEITTEYKSTRSNSNYQYDLQVEKNSNYFAHHILVHNTNVSIVIQDGVINGIFNRTARIPFFNKGKKHIVDGLLESHERGYCELLDGQHFGELIGPKVNGNPHKIESHLWIPFQTFGKKHLVYKSWHKYPKTYDNIRDWFMKPISEGGIFSLYARMKGIEQKPEGVVFYNLKTGQRAKLRLDMFDFWRGQRHQE